jgi:hypothetical protein
MAAPPTTRDGGDDDDATPTLLLHIVHIPALQRHLSSGWSEDQLLSGRVYTVGRMELDVRVPVRSVRHGGKEEEATLMDLAELVEDAWGCDVEEQAYRTAVGLYTFNPLEPIA